MASTDSTTPDMAAPAAFGGLQDEQFIALFTYRRSGEGVRTPVWFAFADGALVVVTGPEAGKVKRIKNNSRVTIYASDRVGTVHGESYEGTARVVTAETTEGQRAEAALSAKYGLQRKIIGAMRRSPGGSVYLIVTPVV